MGNHEYCSDCGASDFHYGRPCNPEQLKRHQAWEAQIKERQERGAKRAKQLVASLKAQGFDAQQDWDFPAQVIVRCYK